jgi:hypothetical protein
MSFNKVAADSPVPTTGPTEQTLPKTTVGYRNKTWREAAGQTETAARLARLPPGLRFPEDYPEPIAYDAARKLLIYRGFMYHGSYTYLRQLSADAAYLAALDQIYVGSSSSASRAQRRLRWLAVALVLVLVAVGAWWCLRQ